ncbi:hypothetical protein OGAPHI_001080 [Ogataea philodendri]|uniref:Uncharacterized protein n=1 Tax=Ogataea philodendri TaxID=1378263 RepID=A0A9P8T9R0_9ASCO|nr:uncharacterized protein OGAPHI_001080 [Ogataea philodendri]KAH3670565.1 hypothetical protein OGAPHI_001080 [Ogataea philodendri]
MPPYPEIQPKVSASCQTPSNLPSNGNGNSKSFGLSALKTSAFLSVYIGHEFSANNPLWKSLLRMCDSISVFQHSNSVGRHSTALCADGRARSARFWPFNRSSASTRLLFMMVGWLMVLEQPHITPLGISDTRATMASEASFLVSNKLNLHMPGNWRSMSSENSKDLTMLETYVSNHTFEDPSGISYFFMVLVGRNSASGTPVSGNTL